MDRDLSIDIAKGIGIILVVYGHTKNCPIVDLIFAFHMPLFFLLSSMFIKIEETSNFIYKKFRTLVIPFVIVYGLAFCLKIPYFYLCRSKEDTLKGIIDGTLLKVMNINGPLWFLACLMVVSCMYFYIIKYIRNKYLQATIILILFGVGSIGAIYNIDVPIYFCQACIYLLFFPIGTVHWKYRKLYKQWDFIIFPMCAILFGVLWYIFPIHINLSILQYEKPMIFIILALTGSQAVIALSSIIAKSKLTLVKKIISKLGCYSLYIMCFHLCFGYLHTPLTMLIKSPIIVGVIESIAEITICYFIAKICNHYIPFIFANKPLKIQ